MSHPSKVRMTGPLVEHQDGLWSDLLGLGYTPLSAKNLLRVAAHLSRWLQARLLSPSELTEDRIDAFLRDRRTAGYVCWRTPRGLRPILGYLRSVGAVPPSELPGTDPAPQAALLEAYQSYLFEERGITSRTVEGYLPVIRKFFSAIGFADPGDLHGLCTATVSRFVLDEARSSSVHYAKKMVTALRSFLRYLHVRGDCGDLADAVPAVAGCRDSGLPKGLREEEVRRLIETCDVSTATGRRDLAVLLLLSRLGLRAGEVAALKVEDVGWTRGDLLVQGKGSRGVLPLPHDVGAALADYVQRGRPRSTSRKLFFQVRAPYRELTSQAVGGIVQSASTKAHLPPMGSHRLRHTAATQMLNRGASLSEVARVLRHRSLLTTVIYAKVDRHALRDLARSWPGSES
jgi:integrase/recombinase XerD